MPDLEAKYREAQAKFSASGSDKDYAAFKKAKYAFAQERTERKIAEEADPNHPRGTTLASVED